MWVLPSQHTRVIRKLALLLKCHLQMLKKVVCIWYNYSHPVRACLVDFRTFIANEPLPWGKLIKFLGISIQRSKKNAFIWMRVVEALYLLHVPICSKPPSMETFLQPVGTSKLENNFQALTFLSVVFQKLLPVQPTGLRCTPRVVTAMINARLRHYGNT